MPPLVLTRAEAAEIDRRARDECGLPTSVLMEHAGRSVAELALEILGTRPPATRVVVFCGGGNNGGDGFVAARFLDAAGIRVECLCLAPLERTGGDARTAREIASRSGLVLTDLPDAPAVAAARARLLAAGEPLLLVDALLGTGFAGALRAPLAEAIEAQNVLRARENALTLAVDLPSGLDADRGTLATPTVQADVTGTFVAEKQGFESPLARTVLGRVVVLGIGAPRRALERTLAGRSRE